MCASERTRAKRGAPAKQPRLAHTALLILGAFFLLIPAFSGYIWFDESYTLALVAHGPSDIWRIGAADVHPVLYYEVVHALLPALDTLGTAVGAAERALGIDPVGSLGLEAPAGLATRILGLRLFSIAGTWCTALLGRTHVSRDYGPRAGFAFSLLSLFTPVFVELSSQIRMYSWTIFAVTACGIYGLRIMRRVRDGHRPPVAWWTCCGAASLSAAYLHYYGTLTAFSLNALLLIGLLRSRLQSPMETKRAAAASALRAWTIAALLQVIAFLPWLRAAMEQTVQVGTGFWINLDLAQALVPFGWPLAVPIILLLVTARSGRRKSTEVGTLGHEKHLSAEQRAAVVWGISAYALVLLAAVSISLALGNTVVIERYLAVPLSPSMLAMAVLTGNLWDRTARTERKVNLTRSALIVGTTALIALGLDQQAIIVRNTYGQQEPLAYLDRLTARNAHAPLVSDSVNIAGVVAMVRPDTPQTFVNAYGERSALAYEAFAPTMLIAQGWEHAGLAPEERFIYLGTYSPKRRAPGKRELETTIPGRVIELRTFPRPHEHRPFIIALMEATP